MGVALTDTGEVWTWGLALGQYKHQFRSLLFVSGLLDRIGLHGVRWGEPRPIIRDPPWQLRNLDPEDSAKH